ncbi:MAG: YaaA family protein [Bacteroidales bacterium]
MLVILPPSTLMDMTPVKVAEETTAPIFQKQADFIAGLMKNLSVHEIAEKMQISSELATKTYEEYQHFDDPACAPKPALFAFNGSLYKAMAPQNLTPADVHFAQQHLRILSSLYGVLRPLDLVKAFRSSFYLRLYNLGADDLFDFWKELITNNLKEEAANLGQEVLYLAVEDMLKVVETDILMKDSKVAIATFKDWRDDKWKEIREFSKPAKANMVDWIIQNKVDKLEDVKKWSWKGYKFNEKLSDPLNWVFTRELSDIK